MSRLLVLPVLVVALLVGIPAARAHTDITGSDPVDGATMKKAPDRVTISFSEPPLDTGLAVVATGPTGRTPLSASVSGTDVVAPWPPESAPGAYRVAYRVVADDGHPIEGSITFTIRGAGGPTSSPSATASDAPAVEDETPSGIPTWLWIVALLLVAGAAVLLTRRGRQDG